MRGPSLTKEITKDTPGAVYVPSTFGGQGGPTKEYYREKTNQELQHVIGAQDAATRAAGPPKPGMVFHSGTAWNPMSDAKPTPGYYAYPSTGGFFGDTLGNIFNIAKTVAPIALTALGANYLLPSLMGTGAAAAGGAELLGAEALAGGAGGASAAPGILTAGSAPGALSSTLPGYFAAPAAGMGVAMPTGFNTAGGTGAATTGATNTGGLSSIANKALDFLDDNKVSLGIAALPALLGGKNKNVAADGTTEQTSQPVPEGAVKFGGVTMSTNMIDPNDTRSDSQKSFDYLMGAPGAKNPMLFYHQQEMAQGGIASLAAGGLGSLGGYSDGGQLLRGPGDGVSDSIPATIGQRKPARLADGEFVVPARIVSELGNGSTEAGAKQLYAMMARIQAGRAKTTGKNQVAKNSKAVRHLPA